MWRMLQQALPDDYVLATGETRSVREFAELAFAEIGMPIIWEGEGATEIGRDARDGSVRVEVDPRYFRPTEVDVLMGDATKARRAFGWQPMTPFEAMVREMVAADRAALRKPA
jgi:GDPmannose 4,6-dehydratase